MNFVKTGLVVLVWLGCQNGAELLSQQQAVEPKPTQSEPRKLDKKPTKAQVLEVKALIEQLVLEDKKASNQPTIRPGIDDDSKDYRERFEKCRTAFSKLYELGELSLPILSEHLDDDRQSINFRNHYMGNSVGDACHWNIYFQLVSNPRNYSRYGYAREGRDGENHPKPAWSGSPFQDAGGIREWLEENKELGYIEKQIKCVSWFLDQEKRIGACDADSYFLNIHPLEVRILELRKSMGEDVDEELSRQRKIATKKLVDQIPKELLPEK